MARVPYVSQPFVGRTYDYGPTTRIADLMQQSGQHRADAERQQGLIGAARWNTIGDIASQTIGSLAQYAADKPRREMAQLQVDETKRTLRGNQQERDIKRLSLTQNEQGVYSFDRDLLTKEMTAAGLSDRVPGLLKDLDEADQAALGYKQAKIQFGQAAMQPLLRQVAAMGFDPTVFKSAAEHFVANGFMSEQEVAPYLAKATTPEGVQQIVMALSGQAAPKPLDPVKLGENELLLDPNRRTPEGGAVEIGRGLPKQFAPEKPAAPPNAGSFEDYVVSKFGPRPTPPQVLQARKEYTESGRDPSSPAQGGLGNDIQAIADGIEAGITPPDLAGLYRYGAPLKAELARRGFDLTKANQDWKAVQRHLTTLNGAQQTRLRQAIYTASDSLDVIDDLAKQWKGGQFPLLNKANLFAAKNGAYGKDVASIATQLEGQITDVTSELANAYMGGNSPTDHALQLAEKNLRSDWDEKVLRDMIKLARTNLKIRRNSIEQASAITTQGATEPPAKVKKNPF